MAHSKLIANPDALSTLSVLEAAELSKLLEEKWGVAAMAPVAIAFGAAAVAARFEDLADRGETFSVILAKVGDNRRDVIRTLRHLRADLTLAGAKALVDQAPTSVGDGLSRADAQRVIGDLDAAGAVAMAAIGGGDTDTGPEAAAHPGGARAANTASPPLQAAETTAAPTSARQREIRSIAVVFAAIVGAPILTGWLTGALAPALLALFCTALIGVFGLALYNRLEAA